MTQPEYYIKLYKVRDENDDVISTHPTRSKAIISRREYLARNPELDRDTVKIHGVFRPMCTGIHNNIDSLFECVECREYFNAGYLYDKEI